MPRPGKRKGSTKEQANLRIPVDLVGRMRGRYFSFSLPSGDLEGRPIAIRAKAATHLAFSLRTTDPSLIAIRNAAVVAQFEAIKKSEREGPQALTMRQVHALAKEIYLETKAVGDDGPIGKDVPAIWKALTGKTEKLLKQAAEGDSSSGLAIRTGMRKLEAWYGPTVDAKLAEKLLVVDEPSRQALIEEAAKADLEGFREVERNLAGDYSTPAKASLLPAWSDPDVKTGSADSKAVEISSVIDRWAKESKSKAATIRAYRSNIDDFIKCIGHSDIKGVTRDDIVKWKDRLVDRGLSAKTINFNKLASLTTVLNYAVNNGVIPFNPAKGVKDISERKAIRKRDKGLTDTQAKVILEAAKKEADPLYRWVPFILATCGARIAEITQLQKSDIKHVDGVWIMDIDLSGEGASVKNQESVRRVPIHQALIDGGFLAFVEASKAGPLFYRPGLGKNGVTAPAKLAANYVGRFVNGLKIEGLGRRAGIDPNHGWRHRFKTKASEAGISEKVSDGLTGHTPANEGGKYGSAGSLPFLKECIDKISLPVLP